LTSKRRRRRMPIMKYPIVGCLIMLLVSAFGTRAQNQPFKDQEFKDQPFNQFSPGCCTPYQGGVVTPPRGIDFKMIIIIPPKDLDPGIVMNPCPQLQTSPPKISGPDNVNGVGQFFKLPPFPNMKPSDRSMHFWN
jgi:hypothetical protein